MLRTLLAEQLWFGLAVVTVLYVLDYQLSVIGVKWFRRGADAHYDMGGSYELNPPFEQDIDEERLFSKTHVIALVRIWIVLGLVWGITWWLDRLPGGLCRVRRLLRAHADAGDASPHAEHRALPLRGHQGRRRGRARSERWLEFKVSAAVFWFFSVAYLLLWLLLGDVFFVGGVVGTALAGARFWIFGGEAEETGAAEGEGDQPARTRRSSASSSRLPRCRTFRRSSRAALTLLYLLSRHNDVPVIAIEQWSSPGPDGSSAGFSVLRTVTGC